MVVLWAFIVKFQSCSEVSGCVVGFYCEVSVCTVVRSVWLCCGLLL